MRARHAILPWTLLVVFAVRLLPDQECAESLWMLSLHSDVSHDGQVGTAACPVQEVVNVLGRPFEDGFDPAVGQVAHPPAHTVLKSHLPAGAAEVDALNLTGDHHPIADHKQKVRRNRRRCGIRRNRRSRQIRAFAGRATLDTYASFLDHRGDAIYAGEDREVRSPSR